MRPSPSHRWQIALKGPEPDAAKAQTYFERALAVARPSMVIATKFYSAAKCRDGPDNDRMHRSKGRLYSITSSAMASRSGGATSPSNAARRYAVLISCRVAGCDDNDPSPTLAI
jgi:hypothetical protein